MILNDSIFVILLTFIQLLKVVFINVIAIWMMSTKLATPGLPTITAFGKKGYGVIISAHYIINKFLSKFLTQIKLWIYSFDQSLVTLAFL